MKLIKMRKINQIDIKMRKIIRNKKGISELISYVLLVSLAVTLSIAVYAWFSFYVKQSKIPLCPEGVSLVINNYNCSDQVLNIEIKNKGLFNVDGFYLRANNRSIGNPNFLLLRNRYTTPLTPGNNSIHSVNYSFLVGFVGGVKASLREIEIEPYRIYWNTTVFCDKSIIRQRLDNCQ